MLLKFHDLTSRPPADFSSFSTHRGGLSNTDLIKIIVHIELASFRFPENSKHWSADSRTIISLCRLRTNLISWSSSIRWELLSALRRPVDASHTSRSSVSRLPSFEILFQSNFWCQFVKHSNCLATVLNASVKLRIVREISWRPDHLIWDCSKHRLNFVSLLQVCHAARSDLQFSGRERHEIHSGHYLLTFDQLSWWRHQHTRLACLE